MPTLNWIGKDKVVNHHLDVPFYTLEHQYGFRSEDENDKSETGSGNMIIHGDNLVALKALLPEYEGRVNCIYIDPPYNTGEEKWAYNDNVNDPHIKKWLEETLKGGCVGKEGEDFSCHDKWLCMMYPRLVMLQKLLHPQGAIFISIDDNECHNLKYLCDEVFGKNCFVANISWQRTYSVRNDKDGVAVVVEHLLVYGKEAGWIPLSLERTEEMDSGYSNPDNDIAPWASVIPTAPSASSHQGMVYAIQHPFTGEFLYPTTGRCWSFGQDEMLGFMNGWCEYELADLKDDEKRAEICGVSVEDVRKDIKGIVLKHSIDVSREKAQMVLENGPWPKFFFTKGGHGGIRRKTYLTEVEGRKVTNLWPFSEVGHTDEAKKELKEIFGGKSPFDTPKPTRLLERILDIATGENSIILDSFAGSGTTAHAVLLANKKKHSHRKFILVELMDYADTTTAFRVKKAITGYKAKMKHEEEIYCKKLTIKNLPKYETYLNEASAVMEREQDNYASIGNPKLEDNSIKVVATRVSEGTVDGLGGSFDYYELGQPLFIDDKLNEEVDEEKIRKYIYYTETRQPLHRERKANSRYLLDTWQHTGYYFYYERERLTELTPNTLKIVTEQADQYIIYADVCQLSKEFMAENHIIFKKIPRVINKF